MASLLPSLTDTLAYFAQYGYPLTTDELWLWQHGTSLTKSRIPKQTPNLSLRRQREAISNSKWHIAHKIGKQISYIPFIQAIFVTGSLAMNNTDDDADIDIMIFTSPNTLWITRLLVFILIYSYRRRPTEHSAPNRICDNLYLDTRNLSIPPSLYHAHEVLQAKCIYDQGGTQYQFLTSNSWVSKYLPVAYHQNILDLKPINSHLSSNLILYPLNLFLFLLQYVYMQSKMTTERVGLGFAFFHPRTKI